MLVHVEGDQRRGIPDRERVLSIADVVEEPVLVPVVRGPRPAPAGDSRRRRDHRARLHRSEVALDQFLDRSRRVAAFPAEVREVDLVVLDSPDREAEIDLQRADLRVGLVRPGAVDGLELGEDLVPLADVTLIQPVVSLDRGPRDTVELEKGRFELARRDVGRTWACVLRNLRLGDRPPAAYP